MEDVIVIVPSGWKFLNLTSLVKVYYKVTFLLIIVNIFQPILKIMPNCIILRDII